MKVIGEEIYDLERGEYIPEREVESRTGIKVQTLRNWRHKGKGFSYVKIGRAVRYRWQDVLDYMEDRKVDPERRDQL
ncbi:MAG: transcriptional regulator [Deltaproteobacteria bacterium HGW-Deltaproteobacteria-15]|jgi:predicted DNA-binding transcriptional regulator AlpA|nr:MAG: transcriptional regulator [Deltaproteobacteria bacterium HGW-Deltaproteobacteria-15]